MTTEEAVTLLAVQMCAEFAACPDSGTMAVRLSDPSGVYDVPDEHLDSLVERGFLALVETDEVHVTAAGANELIARSWIERVSASEVELLEGGRYWLTKAVRRNKGRALRACLQARRAELMALVAFGRKLP